MHEAGDSTILLRLMLNLPQQADICIPINNGDSIAACLSRFLTAEVGEAYRPYLLTRDGDLLCVAMVDYQYQPLDYLLKPGEQLTVIPWVIGG